MKMRWMIVLVPALSGCAMQDFGWMNGEEYYAAHPRENKVVQVTRSHNVVFDDAHNSLSEDERQALIKFIGDARPKSVEKLVLETPPDDKQAAVRRRLVQAELNKAGLASVRAEMKQEAATPEDTVTLVITQLQVVGPDCPDWSESATANYSNHWHSHMRCATVSNLGRMVEDPRDLVRGRGDPNADTANAVRAVEAYHGVGAAGAGGDPLSGLLGAMGSAMSGAAGSSGGAAASGASSGSGY